MATPKQIAANRRNSKKSTGPRTTRGKAYSRLNALRHGLRAKSGVLPPESLDELTRIRKLFLQSYYPQTPEQVRLVEQMACARWRLLYWLRAENRFFSEAVEISPFERLSAFDGFTRRQARYERAFLKAYREFERSCRDNRGPECRPAA